MAKDADQATALEALAGAWDGGSLEQVLHGASLEAVAEAARTSSFMLDLWAEGRARGEVRDALMEAARTLRRGPACEKPDDRKAVLAGAEWGRVIVPTELFRALWKTGEAVDRLAAGAKNGDEVEAATLRTMRLAAQWVRFCEGKGAEDLQRDEREAVPFESMEALRQARRSADEVPKGKEAPF